MRARRRRAPAVLAARAALAGLMLLAAAPGCEPGEQTQASPSATCSEFGARCDLGGGALGVCQTRSCAAGATPPCFVCTPQH